MKEQVHAAVVQMTTTLDKRTNLDSAERLTAEAARAGAELIVLPEMFSCYGPLPKVVQQAEPIPGPTSEWLASLASQKGIYLCGGSIAEAFADGSGKAFNTSLFFDPRGNVIGKYRKLHRFDVALAGVVSRESDVIEAGEEIVVSTSPIGRCGQAICYDLRFPELFRRLADAEAEMILFPSAFTAFTGQDHWWPLLRTRAIENQAFLLAANQVGEHAPGMTSFGHSAILDPWGRTLAEVAAGEGIACTTLSAELLRDIRDRLPALKHRRLPS
jgi:predicted amidohydrolase